VAIYPIEPALARRGLYMLLFPLILHKYFSITTLIGARSGPGIASHSFAMTSMNSCRLNTTWYYIQFWSFEFLKFNICFGFRYSDFELNISIFTGCSRYKNIFRQKKHESCSWGTKELSYSASQADHAYKMLFEGLEFAIGQ
jgi:hypothetical protein